LESGHRHAHRGGLEVRGAAGAELVTGPHLAHLCLAGDDWSGVFHGRRAGTGGLIIAGRERFGMGLVMLGIVVVGSVGFVIVRGATWLERRLIPWQGISPSSKGSGPADQGTPLCTRNSNVTISRGEEIVAGLIASLAAWGATE